MSNLREKLNKFIRFFSICQYLFLIFDEKLRQFDEKDGREQKIYDPAWSLMNG